MASEEGTKDDLKTQKTGWDSPRVPSPRNCKEHGCFLQVILDTSADTSQGKGHRCLYTGKFAGLSSNWPGFKSPPQRSVWVCKECVTVGWGGDAEWGHTLSGEFHLVLLEHKFLEALPSVGV